MSAPSSTSSRASRSASCAVGRVHLVAAAVAERGRRVGRLAERAVEGRGELGRVGQDRRVGRARPRRARRGSRRRGRPSCRSGAITSAPARACETAVRASSSSVASLSTVGPRRRGSRITPQWPWSVYSHRHRSAITISSGWASLIARVASCTTPVVVPGARALGVLVGRDPEQQHRRDAERGGLAGLLRPRARSTAGRRRASPRSARGVEAFGDEHRVDEVRRRDLGLAHEPAQRARRAQPAHAGLRERHC